MKKHEFNKLLKRKTKELASSKKDFEALFKYSFYVDDHIFAETDDGIEIYPLTYKDARQKVYDYAYSINELYPKLKDEYVGLALENSIDWVVCFWAILMSGNKPYLVNLRHPSHLTNSIIKTLRIHYVIGLNQGYDAEIIPVDAIKQKEAPETYSPSFANEMALSTSATTLKEKIVFYTGQEIAAQNLNSVNITNACHRMKSIYKGKMAQLMFLPLYHVFGLFATYFWFSFLGATFVFLRDLSPETILDTIKMHKVTHIFAVPLFFRSIEKTLFKKVKKLGDEQYNALVEGLDKALVAREKHSERIVNKALKDIRNELFGPSVKFCISGGSYVKESTLKLFNALGYNLYNGFGMSEVGITSVELSDKIKDRLLSSIGKPFDGIEYRINDEGILEIKAPSMSHKIYIDGELHEGYEWFTTEDNAHVLEDRYYIDGRKDDVFISDNGENVNPDTVENMFNVPYASRISVLGLENTLTMVIEITPYLPAHKIEEIVSYVNNVNKDIDSSMMVRQILFTYDHIQSEGAIKVSRQFLLKEIAENRVSLKKPEELTKKTYADVNPAILKKIKELIAEVLVIDPNTIDDHSNFYNDLGGNSLDYFSLVNQLEKEFQIETESESESVLAQTPYEIAALIEKFI